MAKIRAYKLAEELGIDRNDIVERAAGVGVELKSPMASLEPEEAELLRDKLGGVAARPSIVSEERVQKKGGGAVIRRRKKAAPEPPPEPEPVVATEPEPGVTEPVPAPEPEPSAEPEPAVDPTEVPEPVAPTPAPIAAEERPDPGAPRSTTAPSAPQPDKGKQRKRVREVVNLREQEQIARQATSRSTTRRHINVDPRSIASPRRKRRDAIAPKAAPKPAAAAQKRIVRIEGRVSVGELARMLGARAAEVQGKLMALGTMVSINQFIEFDVASQVAAEFGFEAEDTGFREDQYIEAAAESADSEAIVTRPPVITVMGHVDHGKTSLLDAIRRTDVVAGEAGGITQHIGAYQVSVGDKKLTFIDTPGHAAFTQMRARGAQVTDLVILVIAATEGIMPQTVEAADHAKAAGVPIIVAANKCDLPGANSQQTRQRLMEHGLVPEEFGGETICVDVSAKTGTGLDQLLEMISLQADLLELKADPTRRASGVVLEARLDKGQGPVATVLVKDGTLRRGDTIVVGTHSGRIRAMEDDRGQRTEEAGPSVPVQVFGLSGVPEAGQVVNAVENERAAKEIIGHREAERRTRPTESRPRLSLEEIFAQNEGGGVKELFVALKADVQGSVEAVRDSLLELSTDEVKVEVISSGVGAVTENDVMLAKASNGIVVAFGVRPDPAARRAAESQGVEIRAYKIIYEVVDEVRKAMEGLLPPTVSETFLGRAEVRDTFTIPKIGTIAGCYITEGLARRSVPCRLIRDGIQVFEGKLGSLKRFKDDVREVQTGFECGIGIEGFNDIKVGDVIEMYVLEERPATL